MTNTALRFLGVLRAAVVAVTLSAAAPFSDAGYLYVLGDYDFNQGNSLFGFRVVELDGQLEALPGFPYVIGQMGSYQTINRALAVSVSASNTLLFALNDGADTVSVFEVDRANGALQPADFGPIHLPPLWWQCLAVSPLGSPLVVGGAEDPWWDGWPNPGAFGGKVLSFQISEAGASPAAGNPLEPGLAYPFSIAFSPAGDFVFTGGAEGQHFAGLQVDANGNLAHLPGSPFDSGLQFPQAYSANDTTLFMLNSYDGYVRAFSFDQGELVSAAGDGTPIFHGWAWDSLVHPAGYLFVAHLGSAYIEPFRIHGVGSETSLERIRPAESGFIGEDSIMLAANHAGNLIFAGGTGSRGRGRGVVSLEFDPSSGDFAPIHEQKTGLGQSERLIGMVYVPGAGTADLRVQSLAGNITTGVLSRIEVGLTVQNHGPDDAQHVNLQIPVPAQFVPEGWTAAMGQAELTNGVWTCRWESLPAGSNAVVRLWLRPYVATNVSVQAKLLGHNPDPILANNSTTSQITITADSTADLTGGWEAVWRKCREPEALHCEVVAYFTTLNAGHERSPNCRVHVYLSKDAALDGQDPMLKQFSVGKLRPAETKSKKFKVRLPDAYGGWGSDRYLIAVVDAAAGLAEPNEANNTLVFGPFY